LFQNRQPCRYLCGIRIQWKGKTGEPGSTGWFEIDSKGIVTDIEHTYKRCAAIKEQNARKKLEEEQEKERVEKNRQKHAGGLDSWVM